MIVCAHDFMQKRSIYADATADSLSLCDLFGEPQSHDYIVVRGDTIRFDFASDMRGQALCEADYVQVAEELGVEVAAIKAVVEIETGRTRRGFNEDKTPIVNFNIKVFTTMTRRHNVKLSRYMKSHPLVFSRLDVARFGTPQAAEHARLREAMSIDSVCAIEGTFWGMFQIGGFNWRLAGASDLDDFVRRMSTSEYDQLLLFANFIRNTGMVKHLRTKNWASFAKLYNGPGYAKRGYHTRMAAAYRRMKREGCD